MISARRRALAGFLGITLLAISACQTSDSAVADASMVPDGIAGTQWKLIEFQSMDDAQGTTRIADPSRYTVAFGADGTVAIRLDCNRGRGSWSAPNPTVTGGSLTFGAIASTRAFCPPPSFGEALASHLGYVRSYKIVDGKLAMSLMADGGILLWEPDISG